MMENTEATGSPEGLTIAQFSAEVERDLWMKPREFARAVGWTPANVYYHCQNGTIDHVRIGGEAGHIWIPSYELVRVMSNGRRA